MMTEEERNAHLRLIKTHIEDPNKAIKLLTAEGINVRLRILDRKWHEFSTAKDMSCHRISAKFETVLVWEE